MPTWGDKFTNTTTARQAVPRNLKLGGPRNLAVESVQPQPSNSSNLRNVQAMPPAEPEVPEG